MVDEPPRPISKPDLRSSKVSSDRAKEAHKKAVKTAFRNIQVVENEIAQSTESARLLELNGGTRDFTNYDMPSNRRTRDSDSHVYSRNASGSRHTDLSHPPVVDLSTKKALWEQKIQLHIRLADRYLSLIKLDYAFSEKKNLDSLCWKRAIYSLVDQFRQALKASAKHVRSRKSHTDSGDIIDIDSEDDSTSESHSSNGPKGPGKDDDSAYEEYIMLKLLFNNFLNQADDFYEQLMIAVHEVDLKSGRAAVEFTSGWLGIRRQKWFKCVPNRGDLARYRWTFTSDTDKDREVAEKWNITGYVPIKREEARRIAWKWYTLTSWLMPNAGKPCFNLALLMQGQKSLEACHKLYLNMCSLIVRRNAFVNGREGILLLFEENRRWVAEYTKTSHLSTSRRQKAMREIQARNVKKDTDSQSDNKFDSDQVIISLYLRLHGMMFTKIGLDQFTEIRRRYFESLFPRHFPYSYEFPPKSSNRQGLSGTEQFWMETAVTNIASLYHYNYSTSRLARITSEVFRSLELSSQVEEASKESAVELEAPENAAENAELKRTSSSFESLDSMVSHMQDDELFAHGIDLTIQTAVELLKRYDTDDQFNIPTPILPAFPYTVVALADSDKKPWWVETITPDQNNGFHEQSWLVYMHVLLQWLAVSSLVCQGVASDTSNQNVSYWELLIGPILRVHVPSERMNRSISRQIDSKVSDSFWALLISFFNKIMQSLSNELNCTLVDKFIVRLAAEIDENDKDARNSYLLQAAMTMPVLPEEATLKGVGWVEEGIQRSSKSNMQYGFDDTMPADVEMQRKLRIISYAFVLHQQMPDIFCFDTVEETFYLSHHTADKELENMISKTGTTILEDEKPLNSESMTERETNLETSGAVVGHISESEEEAEENSIIQQLKARRKQLEQDLLKASSSTPQQNVQKTRREEKLQKINELKEQVVPGLTHLVIDTNCFIGDLANIKKLVKSGKWQIVVPLVVVTELDGLRTNPSTLGRAAKEALEYLEQLLPPNTPHANRPHNIRIQTSHNNFLHDISVRSEQFMWGETDRNLDDLVLSVCLWWTLQPATGAPPGVEKACLVTSDRNLSVKARARDLRVADTQSLARIKT
ncbi:hypothetical protein INT43_000931 [Umbelopsis isabellina]|uniref:PIN domain-containing protein n=1 Tax=Mortierella isabellina TaxID=91625 RepID=A0A8H7UMA8_MORIS|nr:hypothetical protein INT43_000931 [Umbelopsis isabellina]